MILFLSETIIIVDGAAIIWESFNILRYVEHNCKSKRILYAL